jgi:RNase H-fold protein (predicted Holliday junction resolvase)
MIFKIPSSKEILKDTPLWIQIPFNNKEIFKEKVNQLNRYKPMLKQSSFNKVVVKMKKNNKEGLYVKLEDIINIINGLE